LASVSRRRKRAKVGGLPTRTHESFVHTRGGEAFRENKREKSPKVPHIVAKEKKRAAMIARLGKTQAEPQCGENLDGSSGERDDQTTGNERFPGKERLPGDIDRVKKKRALKNGVPPPPPPKKE